ncbi:MAG: baseplate protein [Alphaproteobacteria bacterium]|nr:baseplate protein [Alphaproteobacteria bacterium]
MASLPTKTFTQLLQGQVAAIQASAAGLIDFSVGSVLRGIIEAVAQVVLWLQGLILQLLSSTRAATAAGADLDTWMADFGVARLAAAAAAGTVTFTRFTTTQQGLVPAGSKVETADGTQVYSVAIDTTNVNWNAALNGYVLGIGVASIDLPVTADTAGAAGNAAPGAVTVIFSAISGIDTVTNALAFSGGQDQETDAAFRVRFVAYIASLSKATVGAIKYALTSLQSGVSCTVTENFTYAGVAQNGHFSVIVDDGTGAPSSGFLATAYAAVDDVRPVSSSFEVNGPTLVTAAIGMTLSVAAGYDKTATGVLVNAAIVAYVNSLGLGVTLPYTRLAQIAYDASPGVANVTAVTLQAGTADLTATAAEVIKTSTGNVTIATP